MTIKQELKRNIGYIYGFALVLPIVVGTSTKPIFTLAVMFAVHPLIFAGLILIRRKKDRFYYDQ